MSSSPPRSTEAQRREPWEEIPLPSDGWRHADTLTAVGAAVVPFVVVAYVSGWFALALLPWLAWWIWELLRSWALAENSVQKALLQRDQATRIARKYWPDFRDGRPKKKER